MSADTADRSDQKSSCVACLEPIRAGAGKCPHCGSAQRPQRWHNFGQMLKWIGGIVTIISLIGGVMTLSRYYIDWKERHDAVDEIVAAADWLIRGENYVQAWDMYAQAAELNPSSSEVRDGRFRLALKWLRNFQIGGGRADETLARLTEILYRGLPEANAEDSATILAHIGYIQFLRKINQLPVFTDVEALFEQAFAASDSNVYANVMYARWLTLARPLEVEQLDRVQQHYQRALASGQERDYVRRLQLRSFANFSFSQRDEIEVNSLLKLLRISIDMRKNGEGHPDNKTLQRILDGYGSVGDAKHVEALIAGLPVDDHLEIYQWLLEADNNSRKAMLQQSTYILARLNEEAGNRDQALALYRQLLDIETRDKLTVLIDSGFERITGRPPVRALARNYSDDPVDPANPFQFHLDTLEHFEARLREPNLEQALDYFNRQLEQNPTRLTALRLGLPTFIERVYEWVKHGEEIAKYNSYTSGFNIYNHNNVRNTWIDLVLLNARVLQRFDQREQALAQIADVARPINKLDDEWRLAQARLDFESARLYAELAALNDSDNDRRLSLQFLERAVKKGVAESEQVTWQDIKSKPFDQFANDERYRELVRGR